MRQLKKMRKGDNMKLPIVDSKYIDLDIIKKRFHIDTKWDRCDVDEFIKKYGRGTYDRINREELIGADIKYILLRSQAEKWKKAQILDGEIWYN